MVVYARRKVVCICIPYGTALWQVGDSNEQNGVYNIVIAEGKEILFKKSKRE